jgi:hypothetical protein
MIHLARNWSSNPLEQVTKPGSLKLACRSNVDRRFWRCFDGANNFIAVMDDFGDLIEVYFLGRSTEW